MTVKFSDFLTFEDLRPLLTMMTQGDAIKPDAQRSTKEKVRAFVVEPAFVEFLKAKRAAGELAPVELRGYAVPLAIELNEFITGGPDAALLTQALSSYFLMMLQVYWRQTLAKVPVCEQTLKNQADTLLTEVTSCGHGLVASTRCNVSGNRFLLAISDTWKFQMSDCAQDELLVDENYPMCSHDTVTTTTVQFPTGELVIADWLRMASYTKAMSADYSLEYQGTRLSYIKWMASQGVAYCITSNIAQYALAKGNTIVLVTPDYTNDILDSETPEGWTLVGKLDSDLWAATVVDKATVERHTGEGSVEKYRQENSCYDVHIFQVEPGAYSFTAGHRFDSFEDDANAAGFELPKLAGWQVMGVLVKQ